MTEHFARVVKCMAEANRSMLQVIEQGADEVGHLEQIGDELQGVENKFALFRESSEKFEKRVDDLHAKLTRTFANKRQECEKLKSEILDIEEAIRRIDREHEQLDREHKDNAKKLTDFQRKARERGVSMISTNTTSSQQDALLLKRLHNELKP